MKRLLIALVVLVFASSLFAADSPTATNYLRAYVQMLVAEKTGDHARADDAIAPYLLNRVTAKSAKEARKGAYTDATIDASWLLIDGGANSSGWAVARRDRKTAVADLKKAFGDDIVKDPDSFTSELDRGAAALAWFLTQEFSGSAPQPRWYSPSHPYGR